MALEGTGEGVVLGTVVAALPLSYRRQSQTHMYTDVLHSISHGHNCRVALINMCKQTRCRGLLPQFLSCRNDNSSLSPWHAMAHRTKKIARIWCVCAFVCVCLLHSRAVILGPTDGTECSASHCLSRVVRELCAKRETYYLCVVHCACVDVQHTSFLFRQHVIYCIYVHTHRTMWPILST